MNVDIRGGGTIGAGSNSSPLVLIDGIAGDMDALNPDDIENISVLQRCSGSRCIWITCTVRSYFNYDKIG